MAANPRIVPSSCRFSDWMSGEEDLRVHVPKEGTDETYLVVATVECSRDPLITATQLGQMPLSRRTGLPCGELGPVPQLPPGAEPPPPPATNEEPDELALYHVCKVVAPSISNEERFFLVSSIPEKDEETKDEPQVFEPVIRSTTPRGQMIRRAYEEYINRTDEQDEQEMRDLDPSLDDFMNDTQELAGLDDPSRANWGIEYETDWAKYGMMAGMALGALVLIFFGYRKWKKSQEEQEEQEILEVAAIEEEEQEQNSGAQPGSSSSSFTSWL